MISVLSLDLFAGTRIEKSLQLDARENELNLRNDLCDNGKTYYKHLNVLSKT